MLIKKTKETVIKSIIESMGQSIFSNREIKPYDPVVTYKNVHEQVEVSNYGNIQSVISNLMMNNNIYLVRVVKLKNHYTIIWLS